ncbi:MAG TPA: glycosyltransferase family 4 protein [Anaerolineae bacterium]
MTGRLHVVYIIQSYLPVVGGAERQVATLAQPLWQEGIEVTVVTRRYPGLAPFESVEGVPVHRLPIPGSKVTAAFSFTVTSLLLLLHRLRPSLIHAHELQSPSTIAVVAKYLLGGVPVVATPHRGGYLGDIDRLQQRPFGRSRLALLKRHVDAFVTISREIDAELEQVGVPAARRIPIPNGVDTDRFMPLAAEARQSLRAELGLPGAAVAVFAGRLAAEKRVDQLIAIWPAVRAAHPDARLLLLGTGPEEAALKQSAIEGVQFVGRVDDVLPYLQAADVFVLPSVTEGLSVALLEAMATGLAPVATAVGGTPELIDHGQNGWLIPPNDPAVLQNALVTLFARQEQRTQMGQCSRKRIVRDYALPVIARRLRILYDQLVTGQPVTVGSPLSRSS